MNFLEAALFLVRPPLYFEIHSYQLALSVVRSFFQTHKHTWTAHVSMHLQAALKSTDALSLDLYEYYIQLPCITQLSV